MSASRARPRPAASANRSTSSLGRPQVPALQAVRVQRGGVGIAQGLRAHSRWPAYEVVHEATMPMKALGEWVTLRGTDDGVLLDVVPYYVFDDVTSGWSKAQEGARYFAVGVMLENVGDVTWSDKLSYGAVLVD